MLVSLCIPFLGKPVKGFAMNGSKFEPNGRYGAASARCLCTAARPRPSLVEPPRGFGQPSPLSSALASVSPALASVSPASLRSFPPSQHCPLAGNRSFPGQAAPAGDGFDLEKAESRWKWGVAPDSIDFLRAPFC